MKGQFPIKVKRGSVAVKIYRQKSRRGYTSYTVIHYAADGRLERAAFAILEEAKAHAEDVVNSLNQGNGATLLLAGAERLSYSSAIEALEPLKIPLDLAATDYARAIQLLDGKASLFEAARVYMKNHIEMVIHQRVQQVVDELIATREKDGSSERHVQDLRSRLDRFAASFACDIDTVSAADIQDFLLALKLAPKTINNFRTAISNLFSFARLKRYVTKDYKPLDEVKEVKQPEREVGIYTPAELQILIQNTSPGFLAYLVIAAFAGLRQSEIGRLEWSHVGADYIRVPGGARRTKSKRLVQIQPNLKKWLTALRQPVGRVVRFANISNEIVDLCKKAGIKSRHNGLRHSYGSYRIALLQDPAKAAHEMGNSPRIVAKHYQEIVTPEQAITWFNVVPETTQNLDFVSFAPTAIPLNSPLPRRQGP